MRSFPITSYVLRFTIAILSIVVFYVWPSRGDERPRPTSQSVLRCAGLEVVDADGNVRINICLDKDSLNPSIILLDANRNARLRLYMDDAQDCVGVAITDIDNSVTAEMSTCQGVAGVRLESRRNRGGDIAMVGLKVGKGFTPQVAVIDTIIGKSMVLEPTGSKPIGLESSNRREK